MQLVGNGARDESAVRGGRIAEHRYLPFLQMLAEESPVVLLRHALQHHTQKVVVRHNHAGLGGIALHMLHALLGTQGFHQAIPGCYGHSLIRLLRIEVRDGDVRSDAHHLVAHLVLETHDHGHGHNHHGKAYGNPPSGNEDSRL